MSRSVEEIAAGARTASQSFQGASDAARNAAVGALAERLAASGASLATANQQDLEDARARVAAGELSTALIKRLDLMGSDDSKFNALCTGLADVQRLPDPLATVSLARALSDGLDLYRVACPVGVIAIIFEARPEVVVQISALCIKSGNVVILKGGKEAHRSNVALVELIRNVLADVGLPRDIVQLVATREEVNGLLSMDEYIDLVIPRGSNALVKHIQSNTRIPVLGHADGICSVYIDKTADVAKATRVVVDAKTQYVAACNTAETLLVHASFLESNPDMLVRLGEALVRAGVALRCDPETSRVLTGAGVTCSHATGADFITEFLDYTIAVKAVSGIEEAITHINTHGSHHTDVIVTEDVGARDLFMRKVDSAGVYHNASSRFADGFRYGFGAEIGVSTNKTHARGPVGVEGLVLYKYRLYGDGHTVADFNDGTRTYTHKDIKPTLP